LYPGRHRFHDFVIVCRGPVLPEILSDFNPLAHGSDEAGKPPDGAGNGEDDEE
jgi:hypothetical protein